MKSEILFNKNDDNVKIFFTKENDIKKAAKRWIVSYLILLIEIC